MNLYLLLFTFVSSVSSFSRLFQKHPSMQISMSDSKKDFQFIGDIPPLGYFDPLNFSSEVSEIQLKKLREAELHHGRIAMASALILPTLDVVYKMPGIDALRLVDTKTQIIITWLFGMYEASRILSLYDSPFNEKTQFKFKETAIPGQYFYKKNYDKELMEKELSNGRLAMIGMAGYIAQEFVTKQPIF